ncbi:MAG: family 10 glycosylhydrolase [Lachnospiraceae bacterium]|nr:family 10 glycosylhydrolase [Lachnospiraceae bacterium]
MKEKMMFGGLMKKLAAILLSAAVILSGTAVNTQNAYAAAAVNNFKGVWISYLDIQNHLKGQGQAGFDANFSAMCDKVLAQGCNAVIVHVRSHNDAIYPSAIYPWSITMLNGNPGFDPLADMVQIAHSKGLQFHAWINPYGYRPNQVTQNAHLATNDNIVAGVREIVTKYAVDGIHFDDYFPALGAAVTNQMVSSVHSVCASAGKVFGISPQGNLDNNRAAGVDIDTWLSTPGYVDYLAPQIYWSDNYSKAGNVTMYSNRVAAWRAIDKAGIPLYVGLAAYKAGQPSAYDPGWGLSSTNLATQVDKARNAGYTGYIIYRYDTLLSPAAQTELANLKTR